MYCSIHPFAPSQWNLSKTFLVVSSRPGCAISPSWYACMICLRSSWLGGTTSLWSMLLHRPRSRCAFPSTFIQGVYCCCLSHRRVSRESIKSASAMFRKFPGGISESCLSSTSCSSLLGWESASAGVLFFPEMCKILKL